MYTSFVSEPRIIRTYSRIAITGFMIIRFINQDKSYLHGKSFDYLQFHGPQDEVEWQGWVGASYKTPDQSMDFANQGTFWKDLSDAEKFADKFRKEYPEYNYLVVPRTTRFTFRVVEDGLFNSKSELIDEEVLIPLPTCSD